MVRTIALVLCASTVAVGCSQQSSPVAPSVVDTASAVGAALGPAHVSTPPATPSQHRSSTSTPAPRSGPQSEDVTFGPPSPIFPVNGGDATFRQPAFGALNAPREGQPGPVFYIFEIGEDAALSVLVAIVTVPEGEGHTSFVLTQDLHSGKEYFWRVRAFDESNASEWSSLQRFVAVGRVANPPTPTTGGTCVSSSPEAIVACQRARFPGFMSNDTLVIFVRGVVLDLNFNGISGGPYGLLRKGGGNNCGGYSCDIVCAGNGSAQRQYDVLSDLEGAQTPKWEGPLDPIRVDTCEVP